MPFLMKPLLLVWASLLASPLWAQTGSGLGQHTWRDRPLLVFSPGGKTANYLAQARALAGARAGLEERQVVVYHIFADGGLAPGGTPLPQAQVLALRQQFQVATGEFCAVLVGKDGGEKFRSAAPILAEHLFGIIDAMPMRRAETKGRKF
jgi:hypothetical protein